MRIMVRSALRLSALALFTLAPSVSHAAIVTLDFEDRDGSGLLIENGYGGGNWNGRFRTYDTAAAPFTPKSGTTAAYFNYTSGGVFEGGLYTFPITFDQDVVFEGAWFAGDPREVSFTFWRDGVQVGSSGTLQTNSTPQLLAGLPMAVDELRLTGGAGNFVFDDFSYDTTLPSPVPESATWAMMIIGMGMVGSMMRWKRSAEPALI